ncbi:hypothetical protein LCGC14_0778080 [marine sediment metagenome]|uniref:Uncharacterized protein n=1 Tax=marine sediment metagenome TaxID=412755 RepID=A0A0F9PWJ0_9ZZZZ
MNDFSELINSILDEISGKYAFDWVTKISQYHRVVGSQFKSCHPCSISSSTESVMYIYTIQYILFIFYH